jgi:hypothetical protein
MRKKLLSLVLTTMELTVLTTCSPDNYGPIPPPKEQGVVAALEILRRRLNVKNRVPRILGSTSRQESEILQASAEISQDASRAKQTPHQNVPVQRVTICSWLISRTVTISSSATTISRRAKNLTRKRSSRGELVIVVGSDSLGFLSIENYYPHVFLTIYTNNPSVTGKARYHPLSLQVNLRIH